MNERPTPETDAESCYPDSNLGECVCADFARKLERERDEARTELEEAQMCLKKAITELDLASVEIFKWERDFMIVVNDFKTVVKQLNK